MAKIRKLVKWSLSFVSLFGAIWISLALYEAAVESNPFFVTSSPAGTYTVRLSGQKKRPFLFTNKVNYHTLKNGQPFIPSTYIHSGDSMDVSFELEYPHHRWLDENILQLYGEQYFTAGSPDALIIGNRTGEVIKHLKVASVDQFLIFDLQPNDKIKLLNSRPRGDYKNFHLTGEFYDGRKFEGETTVTPNKEASSPSTYYIHIDRAGATL